MVLLDLYKFYQLLIVLCVVLFVCMLQQAWREAWDMIAADFLQGANFQLGENQDKLDLP